MSLVDCFVPPFISGTKQSISVLEQILGRMGVVCVTELSDGPIATPRQSNPVVPLISRADATQVMPPAFVAGWLCNDTIAVCSARLSGLDSTASASRNLAAKSCAMGPAVVASVSLCDHRAWKSKHCSMPFVVPFSG